MTTHPYEQLARLETEETMSQLPTALGSLSTEQQVAVSELLADSYVRGLDTAFTLADIQKDDLPLEVYDLLAGSAEEIEEFVEEGDE